MQGLVPLIELPRKNLLNHEHHEAGHDKSLKLKLPSVR